MYHARKLGFRDKLPFVNSTKSLIFDLTKIKSKLNQRISSHIRFDCEGYALLDTFHRFEIELLVFKLCPVLFG